MRTQGYLVRSIGMTIGGLMGSVLYNSSSWGWGLSISQCFLLQALLPMFTLFPCIPYMLELPYKGEVSLNQLATEYVLAAVTTTSSTPLRWSRPRQN